MKRLVGAAILMAGCGGAIFQNPKQFEQTIAVACETPDGCERIYAKARARLAECEPNTIGRVRCSDAKAHLALIETYREDFQAQARTAERAHREAVRKRERKEHEALQRKERKKRRRAEAAKEAAEWATLDQPLCEENGDRGACEEIKRFLKRYPESEFAEAAIKTLRAGKKRMAERQREEEAAEEARREEEVRRPSTIPRSELRVTVPPRPSSGRLRCCDGSLSPSCMCGGSHRGCCSRHGGVCGCD